MPVDNNARVLYRDVLALDSANSIALSGLRSISDVYVQEANSALRTGAPAQTIAALAIAAETDPDNPAIAIVTELLLAQGNAQLANARLAAAEGDTDRAAVLLSNAEHYTLVNVNAINAVRRQIAQSTEERQFLDRLAAADAHAAAGRLMAPAGDNAQELLTELHHDHDTDPRLLASMERLGERLLTRAVFASATDRFPEATELLDAADALGVLPAEVAAARILLQRAMEETMDAMIAEAESAAAESAAQSALSGGESSEAPLLMLSDLAIENYVAPRFPRGAEWRGQTGFVDLEFNVYTDGSTGAIEIVHAEPSEVFDSSAENAVKRWRFAPRDTVVRAQVTMRFEQPP
jgi:protein TonB